MYHCYQYVSYDVPDTPDIRPLPVTAPLRQHPWNPVQHAAIPTRYRLPETSHINDHMTENIFACLCCCWILGLIGIIMSSKCQHAKNEGHVEKARKYSPCALVFFLSSVVGGIAVTALYFAVRFDT